MVLVSAMALILTNVVPPRWMPAKGHGGQFVDQICSHGLIEAQQSRIQAGEIDDAGEIGQLTLSQQLADLRNARLVKLRKDAKLVDYRIDEGKLAQILSDRSTRLIAERPVGPSRQPTPSVADFAKLG